MASIPCAAYQASHIHAQMRRQNMARNRHPSSASTDSATDDLTAPSDSLLSMSAPLSQSCMGPNAPTHNVMFMGPPQNPGAPPQHHPTFRDQMERVSHWVGDGFKKWRYPNVQVAGQPSTPTKLPGGPEHNASGDSGSIGGTVVKSDT